MVVASGGTVSIDGGAILQLTGSYTPQLGDHFTFIYTYGQPVNTGFSSSTIIFNGVSLNVCLNWGGMLV